MGDGVRLIDELRSYRNLRLGRYQECLHICKKSIHRPNPSIADDVFLPMALRAQTGMSYQPMFMLEYQELLDISESSAVQKSFTVVRDSKTSARTLKTGMKPPQGGLAMGKGRQTANAARQAVTRQVQTSRMAMATAKARQTATNRMKTAARAVQMSRAGKLTAAGLSSQLEEMMLQLDSHSPVSKQYPELLWDYFVHCQMMFKQSLDLSTAIIVSSLSPSGGGWWMVQRVKALYLMGDYKTAHDLLTVNPSKPLKDHPEYPQLLLLINRKLNLKQQQPHQGEEEVVMGKDLLILKAQMSQYQCEPKIFADILKCDRINVVGLFGMANHHLWDAPELSLLLLTRLHKLYGYSPQVSAMMGLAAFNAGLSDLVGDCFRKIFDAGDDSTSDECMSSLAWIFTMRGDLETAFQCHSLAHLINKTLETMNNLAVIECLRNNKQHAINLLSNAHEQAEMVSAVGEEELAVCNAVNLNLFNLAYDNFDMRMCAKAMRNLPDNLKQNIPSILLP